MIVRVQIGLHAELVRTGRTLDEDPPAVDGGERCDARHLHQSSPAIGAHEFTPDPETALELGLGDLEVDGAGDDGNPERTSGRR